MKKSIATKIAALGAIGVMTLAGASTVFASDYGTNVCSTENQYVPEAVAHTLMDQAAGRGEVLSKTDNSETVKEGNYIYEYTFFKTDEEFIYDNRYLSKIEMVNSRIDELMLHDAVVDDKHEYYGQNAYCIKGTIYWGNLQTVCTNIDNSKHIDIDNDNAEIHPGDEIELTYSVSEGMNMDDVVFESTNPDAVSVVKENGHVYATAHDTETVMIIATVKNADNTETTGCIHIHVL